MLGSPTRSTVDDHAPRTRGTARRRPGPAGDDDQLAAATLGPLLPGAVDLLGEVRDLDPAGRPGADPGLDRGADVVDVDVHVPQSLAADHDERVAERASSSRSGGMASSSASSRYITSYAGPPSVRSPVGMRRDRDRRRTDVRRRRRRALAGDRRLGGVEDHAQPAPAGVDHAGLREQRQLVRGARQRLPRRERRPRGRRRRAGPPASRPTAAAASEAARATEGWCPRPACRRRRRPRRWPAPSPRRTPRPTGRPGRPGRSGAAAPRSAG